MDPNVKFLYRTMQERGPNKRRVKPVAPELIQTNFDGFDDSDDDSDFDIGKHSSEAGIPRDKGNDEPSMSADNFETVSDDDEEDEDIDDDDDNDDDEDDEEEDSDEDADQEDDDDDISKFINARGAEKVKTRVGDDEAEADVESMSDSYGDSNIDDDTTDISDDDEDGDDDDDDDDANEEGSSSKDEDGTGENALLSPPIKSLENIWNSIDTDEDDEDYVPHKKRKKKDQKGAPKVVKAEGKRKNASTAAVKDKDEAEVMDQPKTQKKIKVVVCCVCLSDKSSEEEEIVECDSCGISVHEGCYGISESHSVASTESSASTEPWFCDACKANAKPVCELCPNSSGVFKETDNGRWVHLVCALYTPGVAFGDVDRLNNVTLFEMPYSKWGARECILCEDPRFSQTGVCINCDAGMCKAYFHVTCAQREGLLAELSPEDVMEVADPFFAYCKLHADKYMSKMKRRNWLAIQSHAKSYVPCPITDEKEKARFQRKLAHHREKYGMAKLKKPPAWVPTQRMVRHLHTSPSAVKGFLRKAELMGILMQVQNTPMENKELKKAAPGSVSFTTDFISYFMERNVKVDSLKSTLCELQTQNKRLQSQENLIRQQYEKVNNKVVGLRQTSNKIRMEGESLCGMLADIYGKSVPNIPEVFIGRKYRGGGGAKKEMANNASQLIHQCGVCHLTTDQHLLANCDSCCKHYHLGCLDPPLTRMPKKTKLFGWQCSFCVKSSSGDSVKSHPDVNQPRRLRETIKEPDKFFLMSHVQNSLTNHRKKSLQSRRNKRRHKANLKRLGQQQATGAKWDVSNSGSHAFSPSDVKTKSLPSKTKNQSGSMLSSSQHDAGHSTLQVPSLEDLVALDIMCVVCNREGNAIDTVRCDDCMLSYHLRCLSPPMKKSPKVRGYAWHCEACDMSDSVIG